MKNHCIEHTEIAKLEQFATDHDMESMTSPKYRRDMAYFIANNAHRGNCVCQVGCYKGGLSIILAYLCKLLGKKLVICEIDRGYAEFVREKMILLGYEDIVQIHVAPFTMFVANGLFPERTLLRKR